VTESLPAAVLWDLDGTIVDTEPAWQAAEQGLVAEYGGTITEEESLALIGAGLWTCAEYFRSAKGIPLEPQEIIDRMTAEVIAFLGTDVPWRPGALELLEALRERGVPTALVTMSISPMAAAVVDAIPFVGFDAVVSGDMVEHAKPHPDPYLTACRMLGVDPADCVAIEDSHAGTASAVAAGVATIGVPNILELVADQGYTVWPTLEGRTPADLGDVLRLARATA
jgi:HAD superfamily hydrolase (TIGR01509 family)